MRLRGAGGVEVLVAAACAGWAAFFLAGEGAGALLTTPLIFVAVLAHRRYPLAAALGVVAVDALRALLGVPSENPGPLAALLVVAYALGRYASWRAGGVALAAFLAVVVATTDPADPWLATAIFATILFATPWTFGWLVRRRTRDARRATAEANRLALVDPAARAAQVVAEERARLAAEVVRVVRNAVEVMQRRARDAEAGLEHAELSAVQDEGRRALAELRRLLGLLRSDDPPPHAGEPVGLARAWRTDAAVAAALGALLVLEQVLVPGTVHPLGVVLGLGLVGAVGLRRVDPTLACVAALVPVALAAGLGQTLPYGVMLVAALVLLAWSVAVEGRWRAYAGLGALTVVVLVDVHRSVPGNEAMILAAIALAALAGHLWAARDRQQRSAAAATAALRSEHDAVAARAVQAERLRLARELHDVTSHAVGVMVLQAGAAEALRARAPDEAREAVRTIQRTAVDALRELDALSRVLDAGAVGRAATVDVEPERDLAAALAALAERISAGGVQVSVSLPAELPGDADVAATVYRVVQEALTNATRYAPDSRVEVTVRTLGQQLEVEVRDDGSRPQTEPAGEGGFGLVGLAERVHALGGRFSAGPRPSGGFAVSARLPLARPTEVRR